MKVRNTPHAVIIAIALSTGVLAVTGCSVARNQQSVGSYVDDSGITAAVKAKFAEDQTVAATSISVELPPSEFQR